VRVALVHDYLNQYGGAERVLEAFCEIWPEAPIFTLVYDEESTGRAFAARRIKTSFLQKIPLAKRRHRPFLMLMPWAVEQFDLSKYDLVVSDTASFAKGVITGPETPHFCYCHTPIRYLWDDSLKYVKDFNYPSFLKKIIPFFLNYLRIWDISAADRPQKYLANSNFVAGRIKKYYKKEAEVIYPPVKTALFYTVNEPEDYFLLVSRFLSYKKIDIAIKAFNELGWKLKIIGDGPEKKRLKEMAEENIEFLGLVDEKKLAFYYARCRALIFPQEEDFGITALEAMSSGRPVIAFKGGGALEIIKEGENGIFFEKQDADSIKEALKRFNLMKFDSQVIRRHALSFDKEIFKQKIKKFVEDNLIKAN